MNELIDELIDELSASGLSLDQIKWALEDGKWLALAGIPQERAEFLHTEVVRRLRGGQYVSH